jgi:hypothetical protein
MKVLVVHDAKGKVKSVGVPGRVFAGQVYLVPSKGQKVSEIEIPDVPGQTPLDNVDEESRVRYLLDLVERHRVQVREKVPKLVPK